MMTSIYQQHLEVFSSVLPCLIPRPFLKRNNVCSGCGSVGRAVASKYRGLWFEYSHWQKFIYIKYLVTVNCVLKRRK